ncbi:hypothetical protein LEP1GSC133_1767 [Leptospira borgpetersenii serovar Pomona str. 200901868]|uniref:Uncharacterized protein n=1 Tax=Leptospira borgpetersenii serovar Pomona str. 200901868 TaxID=1192866 RepID=M6WLA7_LEPBO|nr:hypothetical protein LEP1GSC133_1767 [Leptospira borgpetersenii serovar Pomona str. 200901868]
MFTFSEKFQISFYESVRVQKLVSFGKLLDNDSRNLFPEYNYRIKKLYRVG